MAVSVEGAERPNATLQIFEKSGHQPFFEEPERFARALTNWMAAPSATGR